MPDHDNAPKSEEPPRCPHCLGSGEREMFDDTQGPYGENYLAPCPFCSGTGG